MPALDYSKVISSDRGGAHARQKRPLKNAEWGQFPVLRKALEGKRVPDSCYGPTSVSDNMFEALHRLVEVAILAREYEGAVRETADAVGPDGMFRDLDRLRMEIEAASSFLREQADHVRAMCSKL